MNTPKLHALENCLAYLDGSGGFDEIDVRGARAEHVAVRKHLDALLYFAKQIAAMPHYLAVCRFGSRCAENCPACLARDVLSHIAIDEAKAGPTPEPRREEGTNDA